MFFLGHVVLTTVGKDSDHRIVDVYHLVVVRGQWQVSFHQTGGVELLLRTCGDRRSRGFHDKHDIFQGSRGCRGYAVFVLPGGRRTQRWLDRETLLHEQKIKKIAV